MSNVITFVGGGAALNLPSHRDALDETIQSVIDDDQRHGLKSLMVTNTGNASATVKLFWRMEEAPTLATTVADVVITIPSLGAHDVELGFSVPRLWMAATAESGAGATAPNADITGFLTLD